jgi:hypothetical protein
MKSIVVALVFALALILVVEVVASARPGSTPCFFFCGHKHRSARPAVSPSPPPIAGAFCDGVKEAFQKSKNLDPDEEAFVKAFPFKKQDQVRDCLGG